MIFRTANSDDVSGIQKLFAAVFDGSETIPHHSVVADVNLQIVGVCCIFTEEFDNAEAMLGNLAVLPRFEGQGIASRLLAACHELNALMGYDRSLIACYDHRLDFYRRRGFSLISRDQCPVELHHVSSKINILAKKTQQGDCGTETTALRLMTA